MSDVVIKRWLARTPRDFFVGIMDALTDWSGYGSGDSWDIAAIDDDLGPAIDISKTFVETDQTVHWLAVWDQENVPLPMLAREWSTWCGASGSYQIPTGGPVFFGLDPADVWNALTLALQDWFNIFLDLDDVILNDSRLVMSSLVQLQVGTMVWIFNTESQLPTYLVWCFQSGNLTPVDGAPVILAGSGSYLPCISATETNVLLGAAFDSIAESLWSIALRDESLVINQNGPIWSAKGRMTTG